MRAFEPQTVLGLWLGLSVLCIVSFWGTLTATYPLIDERSYVGAARAVRHGESPYVEASYLYPPLVAQTLALTAMAPAAPGDRTDSLGGMRGGLLLLRAINLLGGTFAVAASALLLPWALWKRILIAIGLTLLAPPFVDGLRLGNLSLLIAGLSIAAWLFWPKRSLLAGVAFGLALAIKPAGVLALWIFAIAPVEERQIPARRRWLAATATTGALVTLPGLSALPELLTQMAGNPTAERVTSLHRVFWGFGVEISHWVIVAAVAGASALLLASRSTKRGPKELLVIATVATLLSLPIVWSHTYLLALPLAALTLTELLGPLPSRGVTEPSTRSGHPQSFPWQVALAVALTLALLGSNALGGVASAPEWASALLVLIPTLAPLGLATLWFGARRAERQRPAALGTK